MLVSLKRKKSVSLYGNEGAHVSRGGARVRSGPPSPDTYLSKSILTAKMSAASGKAESRCPALGYSTPGAGSARSAQVTLWGSQNLSFQNQAERVAMLSRKEDKGSEEEYQKKKPRGEKKGRIAAPFFGFFLSAARMSKEVFLAVN